MPSTPGLVSSPTQLDQAIAARRAATTTLPGNPTTLLSLLCSVALLTACASADRVTVAVPPADVLTCAPAPVVPDSDSQRAVATYVVDLWDAGEDCRQRLGAVRELYQNRP